MNPDTNKFEEILEATDEQKQLLKKMTSAVENFQFVRQDGSPVPVTWSTFQIGEEVAIKGYMFRVGYVGETSILFEPVGPVIIGDKK